MKKTTTMKKGASAMLLTALLLMSTSVQSVEASELEVSPAMERLTTANPRIQQRVTSTEPSTVLSGILAEPEPQEWIDARNKAKEEAIKQADEKAKKESEQKTKEAQETWKKNFPIAEGNSKQAAFINSISKDAVDIARIYGIYPSVMMAQAGLESDWGTSGLTANHHNYFGVKGTYNGEFALMRTREEYGGKSIYINAKFKKYPSPKESLEDYAKLMKNGLRGNPTFYSGTWKEKASSYKESTQSLQGKYATDGLYANKLNRIIEEYGLDRFDTVSPYEEIKIVVEPVYPGELVVPTDKVKVTANDSVASIALRFNLSIDEFMEINSLSSPVIYVNQLVTIEKPEIESVQTATILEETMTEMKKKESVDKERHKLDMVLNANNK